MSRDLLDKANALASAARLYVNTASHLGLYIGDDQISKEHGQRLITLSCRSCGWRIQVPHEIRLAIRDYESVHARFNALAVSLGDLERGIDDEEDAGGE